MRILLTLQPSTDIYYKNDYYYDTQGFIYNIIRYSKFHNIHDKKGYKFFCFSNIFPYNKILNKNKIYYLLISSPDDELVEYINKILSKRIGDLIYFGKMSFYLIALKFFSVQVPPLKNFILKTETPIIIRIPSKMLDAEKKYNYYYWKKEFRKLKKIFIKNMKNLYSIKDPMFRLKTGKLKTFVTLILSLYLKNLCSKSKFQ